MREPPRQELADSDMFASTVTEGSQHPSTSVLNFISCSLNNGDERAVQVRVAVACLRLLLRPRGYHESWPVRHRPALVYVITRYTVPMRALSLLPQAELWEREAQRSRATRTLSRACSCSSWTRSWSRRHCSCRCSRGSTACCWGSSWETRLCVSRGGKKGVFGSE